MSEVVAESFGPSITNGFVVTAADESTSTSTTAIPSHTTVFSASFVATNCGRLNAAVRIVSANYFSGNVLNVSDGVAEGVRNGLGDVLNGLYAAPENGGVCGLLDDLVLLCGLAS